MSEMILSAPVAQGAGESFSIWGLFESVRQFITGTFASDREPRLMSLIRPTAAIIGDNLLAAVSLADLEIRLDEATTRPDLLRLNAAVLIDSEFKDAVGKATSASTHNSWPEDMLGRAVVGHLQKIEPFCLAITAALHRFAEMYPEEFGAQIEAQADAPLGFLTNSHIHPDTKAAILGAVRADHRLFAVIHLLISQRSAPPWLRLALVETSADDYYRYLRFLASIPQLKVPFEIVPASDRQDLASMQLENETTNLWMREFVTGNDGPTFPFADDDDS